jgi:hypothetical protein
MSLIPPSEAIYASVDTAFTAIQAHAKASGYAFSRALHGLLGLYLLVIVQANTTPEVRI